MGAHRTPVVGHIDCPVCALDMDVKHDKNGHAMGYCPDCSQQLFTRNDYRSAKLLERMRPAAPGAAGPAAPGEVTPQPVAVPVFVQPAAPTAPTAPARTAKPLLKAAPQVQEHKQDTNTNTPATRSAPKAATPWFSPLIGAGARKDQHGK